MIDEEGQETMRHRHSMLVVISAALVGTSLAGDTSSDEDLLRKARIGTDGPELMAYFQQRTVGDAEHQRIIQLIRELGHETYAVRERAGERLVEIGLPAVGLLRQAANDPDIEIARRSERCLQRIERDVPSPALSSAVARMLAIRRPPGVAGVLLAYFPFADDAGVAAELRETLAAVALPNGRPDPVLLAALADPLPIRRGVAVEALIRSKNPAAINASRVALEDKDPDVRLRAALAMVIHARDRQSVPKLIDLLAEIPQSDGWRIEETLIRLAGNNAPRVSLGRDDVARKKCRDAWMAWWDKDGPGVNLAKLDEAPPVLGYTLLVLRDPGSATGAVMEINSAKEVVWKIEGLSIPMDAVVVGKDRVLIAEQINSQVSERDFRGKIIWTKQVPLPIGLQRLPNGNTLVVCRNQIMEWDSDRNTVWTYSRTGADIVAATRARNGDTIFLTNRGVCTRLDKDRKEIKTFQKNTSPNAFGGIDALPGDRLILTQVNAVIECDRDGTQSWSAPVSRPSDVQRLANGNTLVTLSGSMQVTELDRSGTSVWDYKSVDGHIPYRARRR
jgi:hypothetical protein